MRSSSSIIYYIIFTTPFCPPATSEHQWCTLCVAYCDKPWSIAGEIWPLLPSRWFTIDWLRPVSGILRPQARNRLTGRTTVFRSVSVKKWRLVSHTSRRHAVAAFDFPGSGSLNFSGAIYGRHLARARLIIIRSRLRL